MPRWCESGLLRFEAADWQAWIRRFERYRHLTELDKKEEKVQASTFLYSMGPKAEDLFSSLRLSDKERTCYDSVIEKIEQFLVPKVKIVFERTKYN